MENRVRFKIGEIEFEAEGSAEVIERERREFINTLLPVAVETIVRTRGAEQQMQFIEAEESPASLPEGTIATPVESKAIFTTEIPDLSRTSLASFVKEYGKITEQDFTLISAYYHEKKDSASSLSLETVKQYYLEARRPLCSNVSDVLLKLSQKKYIMDDPKWEGKLPKQYVLTTEGTRYVETFKPKEESEEKKNTTSKIKKGRVVKPSVYAKLNLDELNIKSYPEVKSLDTFKKKMLLVMYIITNEGKGEFFSTADIQCIMTDIWGLPATIDQINGVFKDNKTWFKQEQDPNNKKAIRRKLLEGGKEFARGIIEATTNG